MIDQRSASSPCQRCTVEGQLVLLYLQNPAQFPNDGVRYQDQETRGTVPVGNRVRRVLALFRQYYPQMINPTS